jgi:hypothetical protein
MRTIAGPGAGRLQQMPLSVVDVLQVGVVTQHLDATKAVSEGRA